jgi:Ku protein
MTTPGRSIWSGAISFGPVHIPVKMYTATEEREGITFRQVRKSDGSRIQYKRVSAADGEEVPYSEIAKGLEWGEQMVVFDDADLADLPVSTNKRIEIEHFSRRGEISNMLLDKVYYLLPDKGAERAFWLLRSAMLGRVGIGRVTIRTRERTVMLEALDNGVRMTALRYPEEVRDLPAFIIPAGITEQEIDLAVALVDAMVDVFDPAAHVDRWAEAVRKVAENKVNGIKAETPAPDVEPNPAMDLIAVLQAGVAAIKAKNEGKTGE